jgi:hypothetical protein
MTAWCGEGGEMGFRSRSRVVGMEEEGDIAACLLYAERGERAREGHEAIIARTWSDSREDQQDGDVPVSSWCGRAR